MTNLNCERAEQLLGQTIEPTYHTGDISIEFIRAIYGISLETGAREYQREKVASLAWKQSIMVTVLSKGYVSIPEVHIRVIRTESNGFKYELIDGQQRVTSILDFLNGLYTLPTGLVIDGCACGGMDAKTLLSKYPSLFYKITEYRIVCKWYENLDDITVSELFTKILNNVNTMAPQEMRNAVRGFLSTYIRDTARFELQHELFTRVQTKTGNKVKTNLKYFSPKFNLKGRMEVDEWLSELIYFHCNGFENGINHQNHTNWITEVQSVGGIYSTKPNFLKLKSKIDELLSFSLKIMKAVPKEHQHKLTSLLSMVLVFYADSLRKQSYSIDVDKYVVKFFKVYKDWNDIVTKLYINETMYGGTKQMEQFGKLFNGKNAVAIKTIYKVLDIERAKDSDSFGLVELDARETFSSADILRKWEEQDFKCHYTNLPLDESEIAGDHYIPRSWGISKGGVTEYHNLVITSKNLNLKKGARHGDEFLDELNKK